MATRESGLRELDDNNAALLRELTDVSDEKMTQVFLGTWSAREVLVHLAGWYDAMAEGLERIGRGERPTPEGVSYSDVDAVNAQFVEANRGLSVPEVRKNLEVTLARFQTAARALPEDRFAEGKTAMRILTTMAEHPTEHIEEIREWRRSA
jgi:hypothetical protein